MWTHKFDQYANYYDHPEISRLKSIFGGRRSNSCLPHCFASSTLDPFRLDFFGILIRTSFLSLIRFASRILSSLSPFSKILWYFMKGIIPLGFFKNLFIQNIIFLLSWQKMKLFLTSRSITEVKQSSTRSYSGGGHCTYFLIFHFSSWKINLFVANTIKRGSI